MIGGLISLPKVKIALIIDLDAMLQIVNNAKLKMSLSCSPKKMDIFMLLRSLSAFDRDRPIQSEESRKQSKLLRTVFVLLNQIMVKNTWEERLDFLRKVLHVIHIRKFIMQIHKLQHLIFQLMMRMIIMTNLQGILRLMILLAI